MLLSVMIEQFEEYYFGSHELSLTKFKENVQNFEAEWMLLSKKYNGQKIKATLLTIWKIENVNRDIF